MSSQSTTIQFFVPGAQGLVISSVMFKEHRTWEANMTIKSSIFFSSVISHHLTATLWLISSFEGNLVILWTMKVLLFMGHSV